MIKTGERGGRPIFKLYDPNGVDTGRWFYVRENAERAALGMASKSADPVGIIFAATQDLTSDVGELLRVGCSFERWWQMEMLLRCLTHPDVRSAAVERRVDSWTTGLSSQARPKRVDLIVETLRGEHLIELKVVRSADGGLGPWSRQSQGVQDDIAAMRGTRRGVDAWSIALVLHEGERRFSQEDLKAVCQGRERVLETRALELMDGIWVVANRAR